MTVEQPIRSFGTPRFERPLFEEPAEPDHRRTPLFGAFRRVPWMFLSIVVIPTVLAAIYYLLIAAPQYVSDARFVVRSRSEGGPAALGSVLQSVGQSFGVSFGESATDAFEVQAYMTSRDAVNDLVVNHQLRAVMDRPEADFLSRYPRFFEGRSFETLFQNYKRFVTVGYDAQTGISTLRVKAFRAADAQAIAQDLLTGGERLVNQLNERSMADAVALAQRQVTEANVQAKVAEADLTNFRNQERVIDPDRSSVAGLELVGRLEGQLATMRAERAGLAASAPQSPQLPLLDQRITAFSAQVESQRSQIAGQADSLAPKVGAYERLSLERDLAVKTLESAVASLESARIEARRQQLYLDRVVNPNLPDKAEMPRRLYGILIIFIGLFVAYAILSLVIAGLREHQQQ